MTPEIYAWADAMITKYGLDLPVEARSDTLRVLEIGSHNRHPTGEPGGLRVLFENPPMRGLEYVGIDLEAGPGVDLVMRGSDPEVAELGPFDVGVYTEVMEHDGQFWLTWQNLNRAIRRNGALIVSTCANGFPQHDYPSDFYRFSLDALVELGAWFGFYPLELNETRNARDEPSVMAIYRKEREVGRCSD